MIQDIGQPSLLLVEGNEQEAIRFRNIFCRVALHWLFTKVKDGREAVHQITFHGYPDLLITNVETPRLGALEVAEWLRSLKCPKPIPILIYGAAPTEAQSRELAKLGVREHLDSKMSDDLLRKSLMCHVARVETASDDRPNPEPATETRATKRLRR